MSAGGASMRGFGRLEGSGRPRMQRTMEIPELPVEPSPEPVADGLEPLALPTPAAVAGMPARRHPLLAAALSWLLPGLGQLLLGRRLAALVFAVPTIAVVAWFAVQLGEGAAVFAVSLWDDTFFWAFLAAVAGLGAWRLLA